MVKNDDHNDLQGTEVTTENIAERLLNRRASGAPASDFADVLDSLVWLMDDNGSEIAAARRNWLEGEDPFAAEVALLMEEGLPYDTVTMLAKMSVVEKRWPHLRSRCETLRERIRNYDETRRQS